MRASGRALLALLGLLVLLNTLRLHRRVGGTATLHAASALPRGAASVPRATPPPGAPPRFPFPRLLHQVHANRSVLSEEDVRLSAHCAEVNSDFQYVFWNDSAVEELIRTRYPSDYGWWRTMEPPIKRVDASRYFILHSHGGAYIDFDVECITPLRVVMADCPPGAAWLGGYPEPFQLMSDVGASFWLHMLGHIQATLANQDAWTSTGPSGLNDAAKSYVAERGEAQVVVPYLTLRTEPEWVAFTPGAHGSVPWFVHNFMLPDWDRGSGGGDGLGFLPNQVVDPGACSGSKSCPDATCAPLWPVALYAHHCKGTWRGRIGT